MNKKVFFQRITSIILVIFCLFLIGGCKEEKAIIAKIIAPDAMILNEVSDVSLVNSTDGSIISSYTCVSENEIILYNNGKIFANGIGTGKITFTFEGGENVSKEIDISKTSYTYTNMEITGDDTGILIGNTLQLKAKYTENEADDQVLWKSLETSVASVDANGLVTGNGEGSTTIIAYSSLNGKVKATYNICVFSASLTTETSLTNGYYKATEILSRVDLGSNVSFIQDNGVTANSSSASLNKQQVSVINVPKGEEVKTFVWGNASDNAWHKMTLSSMVNDFEENNPEWKVLGAINGGSYDISGTFDFPYRPRGPMVCDGEVYLTTTETSGKWTGIYGFTNSSEGNTIIANEDFSTTDYFVMTTYDKDGNRINDYIIENYNCEPASGESSVYYGSYTDGTYSSIEMPLNNNYAVFSNGTALQNSPTDFYGKGIKQATSDSTISMNEFGIISKNTEVASALSSAYMVRVQRELTGAYEGVENLIGGGHIVLENGTPTDNVEADLDESGAPRTMIGVKEDGSMVLCVVDGRQSDNGMCGITGARASAIMSNYGCVDAYNLDGGGSSTVIIRTESGFKVMNSPSDGGQRANGNCIIIAVKAFDCEINTTNVTTNSASFNVSNIEGLDDKKCFLKINESLYEINDGKADVTDLVSNTKYKYTFCYENDEGKIIETLKYGYFTTYKQGFKFLGITMEETENTYIFNIYFEDPEFSSTIRTTRCEVNGIRYYFADGKLTIEKDEVGDEITDFYIKYTYSDNGTANTFEDYVEFFEK